MLRNAVCMWQIIAARKEGPRTSRAGFSKPKQTRGGATAAQVAPAASTEKVQRTGARIQHQHRYQQLYQQQEVPPHHRQEIRMTKEPAAQETSPPKVDVPPHASLSNGTTTLCQFGVIHLSAASETGDQPVVRSSSADSALPLISGALVQARQLALTVAQQGNMFWSPPPQTRCPSITALG
jgi:hypothetical protein